VITPKETYEPQEDPVKYVRRPDSVYGMSNRRIQSAQSDDSSYGSYHGPSQTPPTRGPLNANFQQTSGSIIGHHHQKQQLQSYGMLPLPNPPNIQKQQQNQKERKFSTAANGSQQIQRNVEFKEFSQPGTPNGHPSQELPPPPPQHQTYRMH
jgi:hypothetical protein